MKRLSLALILLLVSACSGGLWLDVWWVDIVPQLCKVEIVADPDQPGQIIHECEVFVGWEVKAGREGFVELWVRDSGQPPPAGVWVNVDRTIQKPAGIHSDKLRFQAGGWNEDVNMRAQYDVEVRLFEYDSMLGPQLILTDTYRLKVPINE